MSLLETRRHQLFPVLDAVQMEAAKRFASGPARDFVPGEVVLWIGAAFDPQSAPNIDPGLCVVIH